MSVPPPSDDGPSRSETYHRGRWTRKPLVAGVLVGTAAAYAFLRWRPFRVEVSGRSMSPSLEPGDLALAVAPARIRHGHVVVVEHPERPGFEMVKRVTGLPGDLTPRGAVLADGELWVEGDNEAGSTDSRELGPFRRSDVRARVLLVWWPPPRRRLL